MTKLLEWVAVLLVAFSVWYPLVFGQYVKHPLIEANMNLIIISPALFVILFGLYAVFTIFYRVLTFNDCLEASQDLHQEILEAKKDLKEKNIEW